MPRSSKPFISVIIPAYNAAEVVGEAIESILAQTHTHFELIIIDDRSTDATWDVIQSYAQKDKRIVAVRNETNLGIGGNRTKGIALAKADYICWQDADDISLPTRLADQVAYLQNHPNVGVVGGYLAFFGKGVKPSIRKYAETDAYLRKSIFRYNPLAQPASMFRAVCYRELGPYDPSLKLSEDLEMFFRVGTRYEFANVQKVVIRYRQDSGSLTGANLSRMERVTLRLRWQYARHPAYHPTMIDWIFNICQFISIFVMPAAWKIKLFAILRNTNA